MLRSYWSKGIAALDKPARVVSTSMVAAALILFLAVQVFSGQASTSKSEIHYAHTNGHEQKNAKSEPRDPALSLSPVEAIPSKVESLIPESNDEKRDQEREDKRRDLEAQEKMALWAKIMGVAAILTVGITGVGLWLLARTYGETKRAAVSTEAMVVDAREANEISRKAITEAKRPLLVFQDDKNEVNEFECKKSNLFLWSCEIKNYGETPAFIDVIETTGFLAFDVNFFPIQSKDWSSRNIWGRRVGDYPILEFLQKDAPQFNIPPPQKGPVQFRSHTILEGGMVMGCEQVPCSMWRPMFEPRDPETDQLEQARTAFINGVGSRIDFLFAFHYSVVWYRDFYGNRYVTSRLMRQASAFFALDEYGGPDLNYRT